MDNQFEIETQIPPIGHLRKGRLITEHGIIETPAVLPFAKRGMVSPLTMTELMEIGCQGLVVSALPFMVQPGKKVIQKVGSLRKFLQWPGPLLSVVGDFPRMKKVKKNAGELGIRYEEPYTHAHQRLTSQQGAMLQAIGQADVQLPMYQMPSYYAPVDDVQLAVALNLKWQSQANSEWGVIVGAGFRDLRQKCLNELKNKCGYLITDLPKEHDEWQRIVQEVCSLLPEHSLRMLIADDEWQIENALRFGIDIVISAVPIEAAHRGEIYTGTGIEKVSYEQYRSETKLLTIGSKSGVSYAYLHYLNHQQDPLADHYLGLNNWWRLNHFTAELRQAIQKQQTKVVDELFQQSGTNDEPLIR